MIYCDLRKICKERKIPNKYILALVVAKRAHQLSVRKDKILTGEYERRKLISIALKEVAEGKVTFRVPIFALNPGPANEGGGIPSDGTVEE
ncbi:MAG: DNA-directed RNA polymerase, omega subunit [Synergistales bacterium 54_24]|nr:MAG: DNA-directed RNA polymerase, omega subunit [Synergistales bacterium 54_24]HAF49849.1 DNA-directed RNA polymerase subunit omega [Synergistaceae bacterium]